VPETTSTIEHADSPDGGFSAVGLDPVTTPRNAARDLLDGPEALVVVRALPGMGKTRFVRSWVEERRRRGGDDVVLLSARELGAPLRELLRAESRRIVVIDDADALSGTQLAELYAQLLADATLKAVVCVGTLGGVSGANVPDGLAVREIGAAHLKISAEEMPAALAEWTDGAVPAAWAPAIHEISDGWPGLARLLASEMAHPATAERPASERLGPGELIAVPPVANWIRAAVDAAIAGEDVRSVLRRMSLAPVLVPRHLEIMAAHGSTVDGALVRALDDLGLFEERRGGENHDRLRLVSAVRTVIQRDTRSAHPAEYRSWNRLFADGLVNHGGRDEIWVALTHARAGEHWDVLATLWPRHSLGLLNRNFAASVGAYAGLPDEAVRQHPGLQLAQVVLASIGASAGDGPGIWLRSATGTARKLASTLTSVPTADGLIGLLSAVVVHQRVTGSFDAARDTANNVERELQLRAERGDVPTDSNRAWWQLQRAVTLLLVDEVAESIALATDAYEIAVGAGIDAEHVTANATAHLALCNLLIGSEQDAVAWLALVEPARRRRWYDSVTRVPARVAETLLATERLERPRADLAAEVMGNGSGPIEMWPFVAAASARHELTFGDPVVMLAQFDRVERAQALIGRIGTGGGALMLARTRADGLIANGEAARAVDVLETAANEHSGAKPDAVPELLLPLARAQLYGGQNKKAARLALQAMNSPRAWHGDQLEAHFIVAEAQLREGAHREAAATFARAHALVTRRNSWRAYLTIPTASLRTLLAAINSTLSDAAEERIRSARPFYPESEPIAELSVREGVVLGALADGGSTASIAASLSVSPNTVKSQIASIYTKLGVRDRAAALVVAERRGLIQRRG
jgi:DNA-binding CsgD family transcriptional regulator